MFNGGEKMSVSEIWGNKVSNTSINTNTNNNKNDNKLGQDAFMKLLVAQMKNQDPLSPMDNQDFIAQTSQFTMVQELQELNLENSQNKAFSLLGKYISAKVSGNESGITDGIVDSVTISGDNILLEVGEYMINPENIIGVRNEE